MLFQVAFKIKTLIWSSEIPTPDYKWNAPYVVFWGNNWLSVVRDWDILQLHPPVSENTSMSTSNSLLFLFIENPHPVWLTQLAVLTGHQPLLCPPYGEDAFRELHWAGYCEQIGSVFSFQISILTCRLSVLPTNFCSYNVTDMYAPPWSTIDIWSIHEKLSFPSLSCSSLKIRWLPSKKKVSLTQFIAVTRIRHFAKHSSSISK